MDKRSRTCEGQEGGAGAMRELSFRALVEFVAKRSGGKLLGHETPLATDMYHRSLIGQSFPSFWLEVPLSGEVGFDLHVYYDRGQVRAGERFGEGCGFGMQALFDWFYAKETGGVGVGFAHDLRGAEVATGAYVNFNHRPLADLPGFFEALGSTGELEGATGLLRRLPEAWSPWYVGLFPGRPGMGARVGSFVSAARQREYARDPRALARDLAQAGYTAFDGQMLGCLQLLAALPYQLEMQLDATNGGTGPTLGADVTLGLRTERRARAAFVGDGGAAQACHLLEAWGVADDRWRLVAGTALSRAVPLPRGAMLMSCVPAFIKAKWTGKKPQIAKVYLQCATRPMG